MQYIFYQQNFTKIHQVFFTSYYDLLFLYASYYFYIVLTLYISSHTHTHILIHNLYVREHCMYYKLFFKEILLKYINHVLFLLYSIIPQSCLNIQMNTHTIMFFIFTKLNRIVLNICIKYFLL